MRWPSRFEKKLPAIWKLNKKEWMTQDIMSDWLFQFDR